MTARMIVWDNQPLAVLVEPEDGSPRYLVPPVVFDEAGNLVQGAEVLEAIVESGVEVEVVVRVHTHPSQLAELDQQLSRVADQLGCRVL